MNQACHNSHAHSKLCQMASCHNRGWPLLGTSCPFLLAVGGPFLAVGGPFLLLIIVGGPFLSLIRVKRGLKRGPPRLKRGHS